MALQSLKVTATGVVTTSIVQVVLFEWSGPGTAGDVLTLYDNRNEIVWNAVADEVNYDLWKAYGKPVAINGLNMHTLGSGTLIIYYV